MRYSNVKFNEWWDAYASGGGDQHQNKQAALNAWNFVEGNTGVRRNRMTVDDMIKSLSELSELGHGNSPVFLMNLNIDEYQEVEYVSPLREGGAIEIR